MFLPDIQNMKDSRGKSIPKVGIRNVILPFKVKDKQNEIQSTVATISVYVSLNEKIKGINMCYDKYTEVLTKDRGWVLFKDLIKSDRVATLNIKKRCIEYQEPTIFYRERYNGDLHYYKNKFVNLAVTPEHNLVILNSGKLCLKQSQQIVQLGCCKKSSFCIKKNIWRGKKSSTISFCKDLKVETCFKDDFVMKTIDFMDFFGFWLAHGNVEFTKGKEFIIFLTSNSREVLEYYQRLIQKYHRDVIIEKDIHQKLYRLKFTHMVFGKFLYALSKPVVSIPSSIKEYDKKYLARLLQSFFMMKSKKEKFSNKRLLDDIQELQIKCGYFMSIRPHKKSLKYFSYEISNNKFFFLPKAKIKKYTGYIYCCSVPNQVLLVRREGIPMWSGNSRLPSILMENIDKCISIEFLETVLRQIKEKLESESSYIKIRFPYFIKKKSPITKKESYSVYNCTLEGQLLGEVYNTLLTVDIDYTSCCPCSKELSLFKDCKKYNIEDVGFGAHNQRSKASVTVKLKDFVWIEDIVDVVEKTVSCPIYNVLKRADEKNVTEQAYKNPKFVEDMVRDIAIGLESSEFYNRIAGYVVVCNHYESIHQHDAVAVIKGGEETLP